MIEKTFKLSETGRAMLMLGATREDRLIPPPILPVAAARQVVRALLNAGMIEEVPAPAAIAEFFWREADDGTRLALRATEAGLSQVAGGHTRSEPSENSLVARSGEEAFDKAFRSQGGIAADTEQCGATSIEVTDVSIAGPRRQSLREASRTLLAAWDAALASGEPQLTAVAEPMATLRAILAKPVPASTGTRPGPRQGTKQSQVLEMLRRPEGTTVAQIAEAMGWAHHTVRGFFAGLKKRQGIVVAPAERVRQIGEEGAMGSYTIYRIAETN